MKLIEKIKEAKIKNNFELRQRGLNNDIYRVSLTTSVELGEEQIHKDQCNSPKIESQICSMDFQLICDKNPISGE